jgi:transposase
MEDALCARSPAPGESAWLRESSALSFPQRSRNCYDLFQLFLDQLAEVTASSPKRIFLVLYNASWHKTKRLKYRHIQPLYLPPYSPDLNPIECLWNRMKALFFTDWSGKNQVQLWNRLIHATTHVIEHHEDVRSNCAF